MVGCELFGWVGVMVFYLYFDDDLILATLLVVFEVGVVVDVDLLIGVVVDEMRLYLDLWVDAMDEVVLTGWVVGFLCCDAEVVGVLVCVYGLLRGLDLIVVVMTDRTM